MLTDSFRQSLVSLAICRDRLQTSSNPDLPSLLLPALGSWCICCPVLPPVTPASVLIHPSRPGQPCRCRGAVWQWLHARLPPRGIGASAYRDRSRRSFIGDMMIVRASRDLPLNTEITFWYKAPISDPKEPPVNLQHWGFKCDCILCLDTRSASKSLLSYRKGISSELQKLFKTSKMNLRKIEDTISSLASTYCRSASEVPCLALGSPYLSLAAIYAASVKHEKAVQFGLMYLESLGFVIKGGNIPHVSDAPLVVQKWGLMTDGVVGCWMILCRAYQELAPTPASQAEGYARLSYRICVGEDDTFDQTYSSLPNRVDGLLMTVK